MGTAAAPRRIVLFTRDCVFADAVLDILARQRHLAVVGLVKSTRPFRHARGTLGTLCAFLGLTGPRYTLHLVATSLAVPGVSGWRPLRAWARDLAVPLHATGDVAGASTRAFVADCTPDILVCADFNQILKPPLVGTAPWAAYNIHPSLLPAHRGHAPVFHGMLNGDAAFGVTVHALAARVDRGPVLARRAVEVDRLPLTARTVALFRAGAEAFAAALAEDATTVPQEEGGNTNTYPTPDEVRAFHAAGHRF